jgi:hypothetical protein
MKRVLHMKSGEDVAGDSLILLITGWIKDTISLEEWLVKPIVNNSRKNMMLQSKNGANFLNNGKKLGMHLKKMKKKSRKRKSQK